MRFAFTDDQLLFRDAVRDLLIKECSADHVRASWAAEHAHAPELWAALVEMGVIGLTTPESSGGMGLRELDLVLLLEEAGRAALPEPVVENVAVAGPLLAEVASDDVLAREWSERIASGRALVTVAFGDELVTDVDVADALIVITPERVAVVAAEATRARREPSIDGARRLFSVDWDGPDEVVLAEGARAEAMASRAFDRGALGASAQLVGLADRMLTSTVAYVQERQQFGVPIGSFQAIKHHLADALLALEFARPVVYNAAYSLTHELAGAATDVSMAKAAASDAARTVARHALQCHGAIAYTVEYDLHLWMKRAWALAGTWGDASWHRRRVAASVLGPEPAH